MNSARDQVDQRGQNEAAFEQLVPVSRDEMLDIWDEDDGEAMLERSDEAGVSLDVYIQRPVPAGQRDAAAAHWISCYSTAVCGWRIHRRSLRLAWNPFPTLRSRQGVRSRSREP